DLDEAHALLQQPAGDQQLPSLDAGPVPVADILRLAADIEGVLSVVLHAVGQLERLDARLELRVGSAALQVALVELAQEVELLALLSLVDGGVADVFDEPLKGGVARVDVSALVDAGQKGGLPVLRLLNGVTAGAHGNEAGKVLVLRA